MFARPVMSPANWRAPDEAATSHTCIGSTRGRWRRLEYFEVGTCEICFKDGLLTAACRYSMKTGCASLQLCIILEKREDSRWSHLQTINQTFDPGNGGHSLSIPLNSPPPGIYRAVSFALARDISGRILEGVWVESAETISI